MRNLTKTIVTAAFSAAVGFASLPASAAGVAGSVAGVTQYAGIVTFVSGTGNRIERGGKRYRVTKGSVIRSGDVLRTGDKGRLEARMADDAFFSIHPKSALALDAYVFDKQQAPGKPLVAGKQSKAHMRLIKGGLRTISGLIGKRDKKQYGMITVYGLIGIRGTDYTAIACESRCTDPLTRETVGKGLHVRVSEGAVSVKNALGEVVVNAGGAASVDSESSGPELVSGNDRDAESQMMKQLAGLLGDESADSNSAVSGLLTWMESPVGRAASNEEFKLALDGLLEAPEAEALDVSSSEQATQGLGSLESSMPVGIPFSDETIEANLAEVAEQQAEALEVTESDLVEPAAAEVVEPEVTEPEVEEAEVAEPEAEESEVAEAELTEPEVVEPEVAEPEVAEPEVEEAEVAEPELEEAEIAEPEAEVEQPEVEEAELAEPEVAEPELEETEVAEPEAEVEESEVEEAELAEPEVVEPEVVEPEVAESEVAEPELEEAEVAEPEVAEPEVEESDMFEDEIDEADSDFEEEEEDDDD